MRSCPARHTLAPLALAALQLACTALPAPPPSYAPTPAAARPGVAYCSELEGAASDRSSAYYWSAAGVGVAGLAGAAAGLGHFIATAQAPVFLDAQSDRDRDGTVGLVIMTTGLVAVAGGITLLWFGQDAGALENAAARGAALPDDRKAYERCVRAYEGDVGLD